MTAPAATADPPITREAAVTPLRIAACAALAAALLSSGMPLDAVFFVGCGVVWMLLRQSLAALLLVLAVCWGFDLAMNQRYASIRPQLGGGDLTLVLATVVFLALTLRMWELAAHRFESAGGRPAVSRLRPYTTGWLKLPLAGVAAWALLQLLPSDDFADNSYRFAAFALRGVAVLWTLVLLTVAPLSALSLLRWRKLTPDQAGLHVRDVYQTVAGREQRGVHRAACRIREKQLKLKG